MTETEIIELGRHHLVYMAKDLKIVHNLDTNPDLSGNNCLAVGRKLLEDWERDRLQAIEQQRMETIRRATLSPEEKAIEDAEVLYRQMWGIFS
jgi:hypothetical protein